MKQQTYINNQNQEAFIDIILNYKLGFSSVFAMQTIFLKMLTNSYYFCFAGRPSLFFFAVLPIYKKINLVLPNM